MIPPKTNRLLQLLPEDYRTSFIARMDEIRLPVSTPLYEPGKRPQYAHFMTSGIASIVTFMKDGNGVEVGLIGSEGLVQAFHFLGSAEVCTTGFVQVEGSALRISFEALKKEFVMSAPLRTIILQAAQEQALIGSQLAACNRLHEIQGRLARWLLMVSDRLGKENFCLTQEFLSEMLGTQRSTVTVSAGSLQRSGLIKYGRGKINILDRKRLEAEACECYGIVRRLGAKS